MASSAQTTTNPLAQLILEDENQREFKDSVGSDANKNVCLNSVEFSKKLNKVCSVVGVVTLGGKQENSLEGFLSHMYPFCYSGAKGHTNSGVAKIMCNSGRTAPTQPVDLWAFKHRHDGHRHSKSLVRSLLA